MPPKKTAKTTKTTKSWVGNWLDGRTMAVLNNPRAFAALQAYVNRHAVVKKVPKRTPNEERLWQARQVTLARNRFWRDIQAAVNARKKK